MPLMSIVVLCSLLTNVTVVTKGSSIGKKDIIELFELINNMVAKALVPVSSTLTIVAV